MLVCYAVGDGGQSLVIGKLGHGSGTSSFYSLKEARSSSQMYPPAEFNFTFESAC